MSRYYDMNGHPITAISGQRLLRNKIYRLISEDIVDKSTITTQHTVVMLNCLNSHCDCHQALFETKIIGGKRDGNIKRYHNLQEAVAGHEKLVELIRLIG